MIRTLYVCVYVCMYVRKYVYVCVRMLTPSFPPSLLPTSPFYKSSILDHPHISVRPQHQHHCYQDQEESLYNIGVDNADHTLPSHSKNWLNLFTYVFTEHTQI